jgi:mono/diheme cytochrome c family protein
MRLLSNPFSNFKSSLRGWLFLSLLPISLIVLTGCSFKGSMIVQAYNRPLTASEFFADGSSARPLVEGTVPQTDLVLTDTVLTGKDANGDLIQYNPVPVTAELVKRGQERFDIYCVVCHGLDGHADGKAVSLGFPAPPDLLDSNAQALEDGKMFDIITNGQVTMLSYAYRVKPVDRWAIIAYIRAMQLNGGHLTTDLTPEQLQQLGNKQ